MLPERVLPFNEDAADPVRTCVQLPAAGPRRTQCFQQSGECLCQIDDLGYMAALIAPGQDWSWLRRHPDLPTAAEVRASRKPIAPPDPIQLLFGALHCYQLREPDNLSLHEFHCCGGR